MADEEDLMTLSEHTMGVFPKLSIVVVNWNLKDDTLACLDTVLAAGAVLQQIILVDNASEDGSVEAVRERFGSGLAILEMETNLGFAGGYNAGIRQALEGGAQWVLLLNNDTTIAKDMLANLEMSAKNFPEYGILAPLIFYYDAPEVIWYLGHRLIPGTLITRPVLQNKPAKIGMAPLIEVDFLVGCGVMIRRDVFERVGYFDESLFMYAEEIDFFWRAHLAGFRMACATSARMWHKVSLSANRDKPKTRFLRIRNQVRFYRKYTRGLRKTVMWLFSLARTIRLSVVDLAQGRSIFLAPSWQGWFTGWYESL